MKVLLGRGLPAEAAPPGPDMRDRADDECAGNYFPSRGKMADRPRRRSSAPEHRSHQLDRSGLVEVVVEVAALRALHARGAAFLAWALGNEPLGVGDETLELVEPAARDPDPPGVAVVDEDRRPPGLRVDVRGEPADVPAVAHGEQRQ